MKPMGGAAPPSPVYETGALLLSYTGMYNVQMKTAPGHGPFAIVRQPAGTPPGRSAWHPPFFRPTVGPGVGPGSGGSHLRTRFNVVGPILRPTT